MDLVELPDRPVQRHPWEEVRFRLFFQILARTIDLDAVDAVLDVGAGDAWFAEQLSGMIAARRIVCWDVNYTPEFLATASHGPSKIELVASRPAARFDLLLFLDVLEHVDADSDFLKSLIGENLKPGGHVLVSVPAWPLLFSSHDVHLRHYRRYTPAAARTLLRSVGLEIIRSAGAFYTLTPVRAVQAVRERFTRRSFLPSDAGHWNASPFVTQLVRRVLACDMRASLLASRLGWSPPGLSWWAVCRATRP
jgi:trans-aconitate methyltransferase